MRKIPSGKFKIVLTLYFLKHYIFVPINYNFFTEIIFIKFRKMSEIKILSRNPAHYIRETKTELHPVHRNLKPERNPLETVREYQRALNAQKLERVMAKPFVGALEGHTDGVSVLGRNPIKLNQIWSGAQDGELRCWNLTKKKTVKKIQAHSGWIRGLSISKNNKGNISLYCYQMILLAKFFFALLVLRN
jgi:WD40 repeat protein